ncbi:MAG: hypothetical protein BWK80_46510 [Desulfobacteraceae bacterium IS3]|nr:MAG: hypothetical protein BWK80_46510 [Desulfobacteraceae bacterium IS3]
MRYIAGGGPNNAGDKRLICARQTQLSRFIRCSGAGTGRLSGRTIYFYIKRFHLLRFIILSVSDILGTGEFLCNPHFLMGISAPAGTQPRPAS